MNSNFKNPPELSVIMSVYNGETYISAAIDSILSQSFRDFELIVINDGSTDITQVIIDSYSDPRIVYLQNEKNIGIAKSLNRGLSIARGRYIAIMDADDISMPERFSKQFTFLENNLEVGVCGTWINIIDKNGNLVDNWCYPVSSNVISCVLLFYCCIANPTTMYRKKIIDDIGVYNDEFIAAMDYDLWTRTIGHYKISNIPEFLLNYRIHGDNISQKREKHYGEDYKIRKRAIEKLLEYPLSSEEDVALSEWIKPNSKMQLNDIFLIDALILKIHKKFLVQNKLTTPELEEINLFFANQAIILACLAKPTSKITFLKFIIHGFRYHSAIIPVIFKQKISRFRKNYTKKKSGESEKA
jgi:glycosyltransferase involved in cell wall biosynthesis